MRRSRQLAFENYQMVLKQLCWNVCTLPQESTCYDEIRKKIVDFLQSDFCCQILEARSAEHFVLKDLHKELCLLALPAPNGYPECLDWTTCQDRCEKISCTLDKALLSAIYDTIYGKTGIWQLCLGCFKTGHFGLVQQCRSWDLEKEHH